MHTFKTLAVLAVLAVMVLADNYYPSRRILTRDGQQLTPYLGYTGYGGGVHPTIRPGYPYSGPLPDPGHTLHSGFHHDMRNGGNEFRAGGFLILTVVSCYTILRTLNNSV